MTNTNTTHRYFRYINKADWPIIRKKLARHFDDACRGLTFDTDQLPGTKLHFEIYPKFKQADTLFGQDLQESPEVYAAIDKLGSRIGTSKLRNGDVKITVVTSDNVFLKFYVRRDPKARIRTNDKK